MTQTTVYVLDGFVENFTFFFGFIEIFQNYNPTTASAEKFMM